MLFKKISYDGTGFGIGQKDAKTSNVSQGYRGLTTGFEWIRETDRSTAYGGYLFGGFRTFGDPSDNAYKSKSIEFLQVGLIIGF